MMEILHGISVDSKATNFLSKGDKSDYQSLKEKLLQQVGSKAFLETGLNSSKQIQIPKIFQERQLLTLDYVPNFKVILMI